MTKKFIQDLLVSFFGGLASLITALILVFIELEFETAIYSWMAWFVIPIGAFVAGLVAASGYYFGSKLVNHKPSRKILLNMVLISIGTFFLIHYLIYMGATFEGRPVCDYVPFLTFLDFSIRSTSMQFSIGGGDPLGETGTLGSFGYIIASLQVLGFGFGGFCVYFWLSSLIYCDDCSKYFSSKGEQKRQFSDAETIQNQYEVTTSYIENDNLQGMIEKHAVEGNKKPIKGDNLCSRIKLDYCKGCGKHHLKYIVSRLTGDDWRDVVETYLEAYTENELFLK